MKCLEMWSRGTGLYPADIGPSVLKSYWWEDLFSTNSPLQLDILNQNQNSFTVSCLYSGIILDFLILDPKNPIRRGSLISDWLLKIP